MFNFNYDQMPICVTIKLDNSQKKVNSKEFYYKQIIISLK